MGPRLGKLTKMSSGPDRSAKKSSPMDNQNGNGSTADSSEDVNDGVVDESGNKDVGPFEDAERQQQTVESKYKNVDLRPGEAKESSSSNESVTSVTASTSAPEPQPGTSAASKATNIIPSASLAVSTAPKLTVVDKSSKKRKPLKSSTSSGKRDFFGMRRSKKWPMMKLSSCCSKKEQEADSPPAGSLSCICTGYRRRDSEIIEPEPVEPLPLPTPEQLTRHIRNIGGVVPVIDLSLFNPADYPIDDEDERMRRQRAKEMAEGVEVSLSARFGVLSMNKHDSYHQVHTQVDYVHCLVPDLKEITTCSFYWGKIDRYEAEKLLEGKPEGTFLLRDSAQEEYLFSVSFRRYGRSLHARIEQWNYSFSFDSHDPSVFSSKTVTGLIEHYKDPSSCMFFEPLLTTPLHRNFPFDLQHMARSVICNQITYDDVNALPLPKKLKVYCKEYHYKQRVRVRQLE